MRFRKFIITALIGIFALVMEFIFDQPHIAYLLVAIAGGCMALVMLVDMIKTLRRGQYGVDLLAIVAIVTTLLVGDYWASLMILIMLTGGESLEEYASRQAGRELRELLDNSPQEAHLKKGEDWVDVPVDDVAIGDIILVKPNDFDQFEKSASRLNELMTEIDKTVILNIVKQDEKEKFDVVEFLKNEFKDKFILA